MKKQILELLTAKYAEAYGGAITDSTPLLSSGLVDSVAALDLVDALEQMFGFEFEPHEVEEKNLDSAERIAAFVQVKIGG